MSIKRICCCLGYCSMVLASPPKEIPPELYNEFTLNGKIPVHSWYIDESHFANNPPIYRTERVNQWIHQVHLGGWGCYERTDSYLYYLLNKYPSSIKDKVVGIIGSVNPWYECVVLAYGGRPVTIDYNKIVCEDDRIRTMTVDEFMQNPETFDAILSISSIEHDGLGRYGDSINPNGDLEAMRNMKAMLKPGGLLFLAVPIGQDCIWWNAHRVYGLKRFPLLIKGWKFLDSCGFSYQDLMTSISTTYHQPVLVLTPDE